MAELPELAKDLALILVVAGTVTLLFKKLKQPLVLGYIVAGFIVSPQMPYTMSVIDRADVQTWADIGVIFLLFSLGLDFSFKKIIKNVVTVDQHLSLRGSKAYRDHVHGRGFSRTVRTEEAVYPSRLDGEGEMIDGISSPIADQVATNKAYDLSGRLIQDEGYRGIVIKNCKKIFKR